MSQDIGELLEGAKLLSPWIYFPSLTILSAQAKASDIACGGEQQET